MLKFFRFALLFSAVFCAAFSVHAADYSYDHRGSRLTFTLKHLGMVTVEGQFTEFSGNFDFDPQKIEDGSVRLTIKAGSLESGNPMRDNDLRDKKFFYVEKHPEITFVSKIFRKIEGSRDFGIYGDLTIKGITVPVEFRTRMLTPPREISPGGPLRFYTETYIRRKDFKLGTGGFFNPIMIVTGETLRLSLEVEGLPAGEEGPAN